MYKRIILPAYAAMAAMGLAACGGLEPAPESAFTGFRGMVRYSGGAAGWPPADSVKEVRVVALEQRPVDPSEIIVAVLDDKAALSSSLTLFQDSVAYEIEVKNAPRTFGYVVVALRYGEDAFADWRVLALNSPTGTVGDTTAQAVTIRPNATAAIDFTVDFTKLPPQPFQ